MRILVDSLIFGIRYIATYGGCFAISLHKGCLIQGGGPQNNQESGILRIHNKGFPLLVSEVCSSPKKSLK